MTRSLLPAFAVLVLALPAPAQESPWAGIQDVHMDTLPRTADEAARIAAVTAPRTDFSGPWPFEENSGGAQTVRARATADAFSQPAANLTFPRGAGFPRRQRVVPADLGVGDLVDAGVRRAGAAV